MTEKRLIRTLAWYEQDPGDSFIGEAELRGVDLEGLQTLFGAAPDDLMYACFPVHPAHVAQLQRYVDVEIDPSKYGYFVECRMERGER